MQIRFIGNPHDPRDTGKVCETAGKVFARGEVVDISDVAPDLQRRLAGNSHFEVVDGAPAADKPRRGRTRKDKDVSNGDVQ